MALIPAFNRFEAGWAEGRNQLVHTRLAADLDTPVSVMMKLADAGRDSFILESVTGGEVRGRYSIIGLKPDLIWECRGDESRLNRDARFDREAFQPCAEPPLTAIRSLLAESAIDMPEDLPAAAAGLFGYPYRAPYAVAKWGIIGLMKMLAMELGPSGVRVNALCPGAVSGPRMDRVVANEARARGVGEDEIRQLYVKGVSMKTWVEADDIADMALFLASDMGRRVSGQAMAEIGRAHV